MTTSLRLTASFAKFAPPSRHKTRSARLYRGYKFEYSDREDAPDALLEYHHMTRFARTFSSRGYKFEYSDREDAPDALLEYMGVFDRQYKNRLRPFGRAFGPGKMSAGGVYR